MGGAVSRPRQNRVPYQPPGSGPQAYSPPRPGSPIRNASLLTRRQQRQLDEAHRTIQKLQNQTAAMQRTEQPIINQGLPSTFHNGPPIIHPSPSYRPPSPFLQQLSGQSPYGNQQQPAMGTGGAYRDSDYAAVANIAGLNPLDIALLHREYNNLTHGGTNRIDRAVFRQVLRESLVEANNENIDRTIENIFVTIDRNHDGFIDFPEFVGAFRDLLRTNPSSSQSYVSQHNFPDIVNEQLRANVVSQPLHLIQPSQSATQLMSLPSSAVSQAPLAYGGNSPLVISLDSNQSPYVMNNQGQSFITPAQCFPLPIM